MGELRDMLDREKRQKDYIKSCVSDGLALLSKEERLEEFDVYCVRCGENMSYCECSLEAELEELMIESCSSLCLDDEDDRHAAAAIIANYLRPHNQEDNNDHRSEEAEEG